MSFFFGKTLQMNPSVKMITTHGTNMPKMPQKSLFQHMNFPYYVQYGS